MQKPYCKIRKDATFRPPLDRALGRRLASYRMKFFGKPGIPEVAFLIRFIDELQCAAVTGRVSDHLEDACENWDERRWPI